MYGVTVSNGGASYAKCLIIAPDDFIGTLASNCTLEEVNNSGLVCLPAAGNRNGSSMNSVGSNGNYWSATPNGSNKNNAYNLNFNGSNVNPSNNNNRSIYLNELDQYMKRVLQCRHYGRYVDDFYVVSTDCAWLYSLIPSVRSFLAERLGLSLQDGKTCIYDVRYGVHLRSSLSSMMGLMRQHSSFNLRWHLVYTRLRQFLDYGHFDAELTKFIPDAELFPI